MFKFKERDFVLNKNKITSITSLLNGRYTFEFDGMVGRVKGIKNIMCGVPDYIVVYGDKEVTEFEGDLIIVKPDPELENQ